MDEKELLAALGAGIRARRKRAELTISELAELAGIDAGFLAYIETGKKTPSLVTAAKIAAALKISMAALFDNAPKCGADPEYVFDRRVRHLLKAHTVSEKVALLDLLKKLRDPGKVLALRRILGR